MPSSASQTRFLSAILAAVTITSSTAWSEGGPATHQDAEDRRPNVVFIMSDDHA